MGKPIPELEDIIAQEPYWSYKYAKDIIKGRFEKGEDVIAQYAYYSYLYARDALKDRFEKGEDAIAQNAEYSRFYTKEFNLKAQFKGKKGGIRWI